MNEQSWFEWASGIAVILFGWIGKRLHDRVDEIHKNSVTRAELADIVSQLRDDQSRKHEENKDWMEYIRERVDKLVDRQIQR